MRYSFAWFAVVALLVVVAGAASAQVAPRPGAMPVAITIDGQAQHFMTPPIMINGQVMVPMREVFRALNATMIWHEAAKAITAQNAELVRVEIGNPVATVGSQQVTLAAAPILYADRTYVPLQFIHDALGAQVAFDPASQTITIASAAPAVAVIPAPQQFAEAPPVTIAQAQPMVPPAVELVAPPAPVIVHPQIPVTVQPCPTIYPVPCVTGCSAPCQVACASCPMPVEHE